MQEEIFNTLRTDLVGAQLQTQVAINSSHTLFSGHFPGAPVTPGVIQIKMVKDILSRHLGRSLSTKSIRSCKFLAILDPTLYTELTVKIDWKGDENLDVTASGFSGDTVFFKLQATYR